MKRPALLAAAAAALVALTACGSSTDTADQNGSAGNTPAAAVASNVSDAATDVTPTAGGTLTVGILTPCGLDKAQTSGCNFANVEIVDNLTEQLPETGEIVPWLAESWVVSDDNLSYTFSLKQGVTFSNGEVFDAEAVKLNFDNIIELGEEGKAFQSSAYLLGYTGSEVIDPSTIKVSFDRPKAGLLQALSEKPLGIIAPETITTKTSEERLANGVIGSGPFVISEVVQDQKIVVERRDDYAWSSPKNAHEGPAYLDSVVFQILPEDSVRTGSLISDAIQVENTVPTTDVDTLRAQGFEVIGRASAGVVYGYAPNVQDAILSDEAVRQALQFGLDRAEIHDTVFNEFWPTPTSVLSSTHPNHQDNSALLAPDGAKAAELLDAAGWTLGADGVREKDGQKLTVELLYSSSGDKALHELVQFQLRKVGIDLQLAQVTQAEISERQSSGDWQLSYGNLTRPDADVLVSRFDPDFSTTFTESYDTELEDLLQAQTEELDLAARDAQVADIQQIILERGYYYPIAEGSHTLAAGPKVHGLAFQAPWWPNFVDTWIEN